MSQAPEIVTYDRLSGLWDEALRPWFQARVGEGLRAPGAAPAVVLAPDVTRLGWLKRTWLAEGGGPLLGVRFWTPGQLRRHLLKHFHAGLHLATAEDLKLAAQLELAGEAEETPLGVVAQQPDGFLAAWDAWLAAHGESTLFARPWQQLPARLARRLRQLGLISVREVDAGLAAEPAAATPLLGPLLLDGFTALEAPLYGLLRAAMHQAESSLFTVPLARDRNLELAWIGTFERAFGVAFEGLSTVEEASLFASWAERSEFGILAEDSPKGASFRLFQSRSDEVRALVRRTCEWVRDPHCKALGIVLPNEPLLVRAVAEELLAAGVPIHDTFGFFPAVDEGERLFAAWVAYQRTGQLVEADAFLEVLLDTGRVDVETGAGIRRAWRWARDRSLSDEISILSALLEIDPDRPETAALAVSWAQSWVRLPDSASIPLFLDLVEPAFAKWGGEGEFADNRAAWSSTWETVSEPVERSIFLAWLWGSLRRPGRARQPGARDAFAPVQLIAYERVRSARWTHLILAGMNEGLVPTLVPEGAFLVPDAARQHLKRNLVEGPHGAGQEALREGIGFLLDDHDRRALLSGNLFDAISETEQRLELLASYAPTGEDRSATVLSELYQRLFRAARGRNAPLPPVENLPDTPSTSRPSSLAAVALTEEAYRRRFDPSTPFDRYSFSLGAAPTEPIELTVRDWEATVQRPATVWLSALVGLRPRDDFSIPVALPLLRGSAVHELLRPEVKARWIYLPDEAESGQWQGSIRARSACWRDAVEQAHRFSGNPVSPLWQEQWGQVRALAERLLELVRGERAHAWLLGEWTLPKGAQWMSGEGSGLPLRGRIDALLVDDRERPRKALVVDFKTGGDAALRAKDLAKGKGLQLALYGGALADLYQCPVGLCLLKPGDSGLSTQLAIAPGEDPSGLLPGLIALSARGVFGFIGEVRSEYAFVGEYPIAFVPPPAGVAEAKWALTHPNLPREPEGAA
jgi:hypothetical protein